MLKKRIITACVMALIIVAALFLLPAMYFNVLIFAVFGLAAWEWANLSGITHGFSRCIYALIVLLVAGVLGAAVGLLPLAMSFFPDLNVRDVAGLGGLWWAVALLWVMSYPASSAIWGSTFVRSIMGFMVLVPSMVALLFALSLNNGAWLFLYVVGIVVFADVGAYFSGKKFGKSKLAPAVSPGKSWAGFWGGCLAVCLFSAVIAYVFPFSKVISPVSWIVITVIASLASVLGDLLESMVKRHRGIKDSSQLLPGHGGVMDRVDSVTAAAPVFILLFILLSA